MTRKAWPVGTPLRATAAPVHGPYKWRDSPAAVSSGRTAAPSTSTTKDSHERSGGTYATESAAPKCDLRNGGGGEAEGGLRPTETRGHWCAP